MFCLKNEAVNTGAYIISLNLQLAVLPTVALTFGVDVDVSVAV